MVARQSEASGAPLRVSFGVHGSWQKAQLPAPLKSGVVNSASSAVFRCSGSNSPSNADAAQIRRDGVGRLFRLMRQWFPPAVKARLKGRLQFCNLTQGRGAASGMGAFNAASGRSMRHMPRSWPGWKPVASSCG